MNSNNAWRLERGTDGIVSLIIDRPGSSANSLSQAVLLELETAAARARSGAAHRRDRALRQAFRLHRRRGHP